MEFQKNIPDVWQYETFSALSVHHASSHVMQLYTQLTPYTVICVSAQSATDQFSVFSVSPIQQFKDSRVYSTFEPLQNRVLHKHNYFELAIVTEGTLRQQIEDQVFEYSAGQACLLNPNVRHVETSLYDCSIVYIGLTYDFLQELLHDEKKYNVNGWHSPKIHTISQTLRPFHHVDAKTTKQYMNFTPLHREQPNLDEIHFLIGEMIRETSIKDYSFYLMVKGYISRLLHYLTDPKHYKTELTQLSNSKQEILFNQMESLIEQSNGMISRTDLSKKLGYNAHYLNKIVQEQTGMSLKKFARIFLLNKSADLLLKTEKSVESISEQLGLNNTTYFYRIFKEQFGVTPTEYRKNAR